MILLKMLKIDSINRVWLQLGSLLSNFLICFDYNYQIFIINIQRIRTNPYRGSNRNDKTKKTACFV